MIDQPIRSPTRKSMITRIASAIICCQRIDAQCQLNFLYFLVRAKRIRRFELLFFRIIPFCNTFAKWTYVGRIDKFHSAVPTFIHNTHHYFLLLPEYHLPPDNGKMLSAASYPSSRMKSSMSACPYKNTDTFSDSVLWNVTE